jgi:hypothetical protein
MINIVITSGWYLVGGVCGASGWVFGKWTMRHIRLDSRPHVAEFDGVGPHSFSLACDLFASINNRTTKEALASFYGFRERSNADSHRSTRYAI